MEQGVNPSQKLVNFLGKNPEDFTRHDLVNYCGSMGLKRLALRYVALDGRLRELITPINSQEYLNRVLAAGERVDGSSLFPGIFEASESDLYVVPEYATAFHDPFDPDALSVLCRYFGNDGLPVTKTPDEVLRRAFDSLKEKTGYEFWALGEMEYYLILDKTSDRFTGLTQRNYHQAAPFSHGGAILRDIIEKISAITPAVKYGHSEVGYLDSIVSEDTELSGKRVEQQELEFLLLPAHYAANMMAVAKWVIRNCANNAGASATFAPKLDLSIAGSGMHIHMALYRDGENAMTGRENGLSEDALKMVGGILKHADVTAALGNTVSASYLRLRSGMETPAAVCWGERNRNVMIRVPLGWRSERLMETAANPRESVPHIVSEASQTVELRTPDASAFKYMLLTSMIRAAEDGLTGEGCLELARKLHVKPGQSPEIGGAELPSLPLSCAEGAAALENNRSFLESGGLVPSQLIEHMLAKLRAERDEQLPVELARLPQEQREAYARRVMHKDLHKH